MTILNTFQSNKKLLALFIIVIMMETLIIPFQIIYYKAIIKTSILNNKKIEWYYYDIYKTKYSTNQDDMTFDIIDDFEIVTIQNDSNIEIHTFYNKIGFINILKFKNGKIFSGRYSKGIIDMTIFIFLGFIISFAGNVISIVRTGQWQFKNDENHILEMKFITFGYPIMFLAIVNSIVSWYLSQGRYIYK